jgi:FAD/FMN-containing dehydrogenase/Fe-S oxidoreductase
MQQKLSVLANELNGELFYDDLLKIIYATDASVYRILPLAVAYPKNTADIKKIIHFCTENNSSLIPRTAGTSLSGQCVGNGIIVDVSRYFTKIISVDKANKTVTVQPGVVRDELNAYLKPFGLFFGPNTSTSNRCMIGGMVGNNSSGTTSIIYGATRDKIINLSTILSDASDAVFTDLDKNSFNAKLALDTKEGEIYNFIYTKLNQKSVQDEITNHFPKASIHRRNTGYAVDALLENAIFSTNEKPFNMGKLLAGSEGTLAFTTEITIQLDDLPPEHSIMVASHYRSVSDSLKDVQIAMKHKLYMCELMDKTILDCTKGNKTQEVNRFFIQGDPEALLMLEVKGDTLEEVEQKATLLIDSLEKSALSYANPKLYNKDINKAVTLRKAGLGLLGNLIGDDKAVACIEDTAVALEDLSAYIDEFTAMMTDFGQKAVYYAHAGAGELHLRPILNLKKSEDVILFKEITTAVAQLVKKYKGSMSGEHGDGIVRASFIPMLVGTENYRLFKDIKTTFDPNNIFNPGKIVYALPMDSNFRTKVDMEIPAIDTVLDFSNSQGILRATERCNGSGDCRNTISGTMCPSYRATKNEKDTTRARANALRDFLTHSDKLNRFDHKELYEVLDLCVSCKACASECPSGVDMASLKAEFLYQYQEENGYSWRNKFFAYSTKLNALGSVLPSLSNFFFTNRLTSKLIKKSLGIAQERKIPLLAKQSFRKWFKKYAHHNTPQNPIKKIYLFVDEFTNYLDATIGIETVQLLHRLNYAVQVVSHEESGRTFISKGLLKQAKEKAIVNVEKFIPLISDKIQLIGIEPSAILTFRDEYPKLVSKNLKKNALKLAKNSLLIDEFISQEYQLGNIKQEQFTTNIQEIKIHVHCHHKALANQASLFEMLNIPVNYNVRLLSTTCCGMAGSFGYEKEHYQVSMQIGAVSVFPKIQNISKETIIVANGTSCRHQIKDGTAREALHPVSVLLAALTI